MKAITQRETVLLYLPPQKLSCFFKFENLCKKNHVSLFIITDSMLNTPLSNLISDPKTVFPLKSDCHLPETLMILKDFRSSRLNSFLAALNKNELCITHKAALTSSNYEWTPQKLFWELDKEHRALHSDI